MADEPERELEAELRHLQSRLYGPDSDGIPAPADAARLAELKDLLAAARNAAQPSLDADVSPRERADVGRGSPRRAVIAVALIGAAAVAVASLLAGLAGWHLARASDSGMAVAMSTQQEWPPSFEVPIEGQRVRYADYFGVQIGVVRGGRSDTGAPQSCLIVDAGSGARGSCAITEFGGVVDIVVDDDSPSELRDRYADSTVLRFSLRDGNPYVRVSNSTVSSAG